MPRNNTQRIADRLKTSGNLLRRHGVRRLALFGSAVRGRFGPKSDLDFLVELERPTFDAYMSVKEHLESRFSRKVDLVLPDSIKPALRSAILAQVHDVPVV
jgi:hypothetical protein